jgi:transposase, IS30 family
MGAARLAREKRLAALLAVWEGAGQVEAARRAGISRRSVTRLVAEAGGVKPHVHKKRAGSLTPADRESISRGLVAGESLRAIARALVRAPSTISREVAANGGRDRYRAWAAQRRADELAARPKPGWTESRPVLWDLVQALLHKWWSPRQIERWLRRRFPERPEWWVSHEAIYQAIFVQARGELRRQLAACLRSGRTQRRSQARAARAKAARQAPKIKDMVMISQRPAEADDRAIPGHWEGDLILGKDGQSQVATLVERRTRFGFLIKVDSKDPVHVADRIAAHVHTLPSHLFRSLTWDQGTEMADHRRFSVQTGIPVYFCDPRSPWMRGSNENWNGLVRQYLPKGTSLRRHSQDDLDAMARSLNGRPRETLDWHTPAEKLNELLR